MGGFVIIKVDCINELLGNRIALPMGGEQHIHFVFEPFAGNLAQPVQHLGGEAAQSGLGIINFGASS
ncbi:hypothetical protein D3C81_1882690 [compost metagenome]